MIRPRRLLWGCTAVTVAIAVTCAATGGTEGALWALGLLMGYGLGAVAVAAAVHIRDRGSVR